MKQCLEHAVRKRDIPRIILLAPPIFDKMALAEIFRKELGLQPITVEDLREKIINKNVCLCNESEDLAMNMWKLLKSGTLHSSGWILVDVPRTKKEARAFQRLGIIPTHVFQIIMSNDLGEISEKNSNYTLDNNDIRPNINNEEMRTYKRNLRGLRDAYANFLIEIEIGIRSIEELGKDCIALTKLKKHSGAPSLFRIALIGSRGSGCRTLAKYLVKRFDLIDVDFNYIMKQASLQETPIGEVLRLFEHNWNQKLKKRIQVVDNYVKKPECLSKGWVLTNYPVTVEDFKLLDMIDTPPNKVIFVQVSEEIRKERLLNRRYNIITGSKHNLISCNDYKKKFDCELGVHPNDYVNVVAEEICKYDYNVGEMLEYAGESVFVIDGNADERSVRESVEGCLMQSKMYSKPRVPQPTSKIDLRDVEFDPYDEPDISIFDTIMPPEYKYSFI
ncbi:adenylate kinase 8 isoform X2 [Polistes fuscatus]|nr:adenylate kinase 8 isoform X2 [Polistes fuscatus]